MDPKKIINGLNMENFLVKDVWRIILLFLDPEEVCKLAGTCKFFAEISRDVILWNNMYDMYFVQREKVMLPRCAYLLLHQRQSIRKSERFGYLVDKWKTFDGFDSISEKHPKARFIECAMLFRRKAWPVFGFFLGCGLAAFCNLSERGRIVTAEATYCERLTAGGQGHLLAAVVNGKRVIGSNLLKVS